jgi:hypothetical protein
MTPQERDALVARLKSAKDDVVAHDDMPVALIVGMIAGLHRAIEIVNEIVKEE